MKASLHYSESLVRRAVLAFWWRSIGPTYVAATSLLALCLALLLWNGERGWYIGAIATVFLVAIGFGTMLYAVHYRASLGRLRAMNRPEATLEATETHLKIVTDDATSEVPWRLFVDLWEFPEFWLLFLSRAQFITLPLADIDEPLRAHIRSKVFVQNGRDASQETAPLKR